MTDQATTREEEMRKLATQLFFDVEKHESGFTLSRDVDVSEPLRHEGLSLEDAEELLNTWKLRGFHGG